MSVITIRGPLGSGAPEVGKDVAERLHYGYVDREIIAQVAGRLRRQEQDVIAKEMPPSSLLGRIAEALTHNYAFGDGLAGAYLPIWQIPLDDTRYLEVLGTVVKELAQNQSLVILGRGSQYFLRDYPGALHVLTVAPLDVQVKRVMQGLSLDREAAKREITSYDKGLREFTKRYFKADLEDPLYYDLIINTGRCSLQTAASMIINARSFKDQPPTSS